MSTTSLIILNAVLMFGIAAAIVGLCAHAIIDAPRVERRQRRSVRRAQRPAASARRSAPAGAAFVRHPSYEA